MPAKNSKPDTKTYRLKEGVQRIVAPGLVLEGDQTVKLTPARAAVHANLLQEVPEAGTPRPPRRPGGGN